MRPDYEQGKRDAIAGHAGCLNRDIRDIAARYAEWQKGFDSIKTKRKGREDSMTDTIKTNGNGEQARREQEFAQWLAKQSTERDEATTEALRLKAEATGLKVTIDALEAQLADAQSKTTNRQLIRDEAVARRAELEAVLKTIQAALRAFHISHEPLVRETQEDIAAIGGA